MGDLAVACLQLGLASRQRVELEAVRGAAGGMVLPLEGVTPRGVTHRALWWHCACICWPRGPSWSCTVQGLLVYVGALQRPTRGREERTNQDIRFSGKLPRVQLKLKASAS
jgi:hypothetical protein